MADSDSKDPSTQAAGKKMVAGFEVLEKIGQGGMGVVFAARQVSMNRKVALKVLSPRLARNQSFVDRFLREARSAARLSHPNIVQAYDVGFANGYYYFAMEFVQGPTLRNQIEAGGPLPEDRALEIIRDLAGALHHAHIEGQILHRDVKPENVLMAPDGTPKLADLGIAREVNAEDSSITQAGAAIGSPDYISPEQIRGSRDLDGRTDVYSLGGTLCYLLTGEPPYKGGSPAEVMAKHLTEPVPDPRKVNPKVSRAAAAIVRKAMAKDRDLRYPSALAMAEDIARTLSLSPALRQAAETVPLLKTHPRSSPRRRMLRDRSRLTYASAIVVALLALGVATWLLWLTSNRGASQGIGSETQVVVPPSNPAPPDPHPTPPPEPEPKPKPAEDLEEQRRQAAEAAFADADQKILDLTTNGDYDGAIALIKKLPSKYNDLLADRARERIAWLQSRAETLINTAMARAKELAAERKYDEALAKLDEVMDIKYAPLASQVPNLRQQVAVEAKAYEEQVRREEQTQPPAPPPPAPKDPAQSPEKLAAENAALYRDYLAKSEEMRKADYATLERENRDRWDAVNQDINLLAQEILQLERQLDTERRRFDNTHRDRDGRSTADWFSQPRRIQLEGKIALARTQLENRSRDRLRLANAIRDVKREIEARAQLRLQRLATVNEAVRAIIAKDGAITADQMTQRYDTALRK